MGYRDNAKPPGYRDNAKPPRPRPPSVFVRVGDEVRDMLDEFGFSFLGGLRFFALFVFAVFAFVSPLSALVTVVLALMGDTATNAPPEWAQEVMFWLAVPTWLVIGVAPFFGHK